MAVEIDTQLGADPQWANRTLDERFQEAVSRTKSRLEAKQNQVLEQAEQAEQQAANSLPNSPSSIGQTAKHEPSEIDQLASADTDSLMAMMHSKSPEEIERLLMMVGV